MFIGGDREMLDKSIPHIGVLMEKIDTTNYPHYELPVGYNFCSYEKGFENSWSYLQFSLGQTDSLEEANKIFQKEFLSRPVDMVKRCVFVRNDKGDIIGTASVWYGNHFGKELQRVHWVAVAKEDQKKGIAKALLTKVLDIYNELGFKDYIYLTSQTWSYKALNLYLSFGFRPYLGKMPVNWRSVAFEEENKKAWKMINAKINVYQKK